MNLPSSSVTIMNVYVELLSYFLANSFCTKGNKDSTNEIYVTVSNSLSMKPNSNIQKWFVLAINTFITSFSSSDVWFGIPKHFSSHLDNLSTLSFWSEFYFLQLRFKFCFSNKERHSISYFSHLFCISNGAK